MPTGPKNIVICSDGTGQSYHGTESNVFRLYRLAMKRSPDQLICYDPGVGTHPLPTGRSRLGRAVQHYIGDLFLGRGVLHNVAHLYTFLMEHYDRGDRIFLFGFSRGAFTVRALAGLVHVCGLLHRDDVHLVRYATGLYQTSESRIRKTKVRRKRSEQTTRDTPIDHARSDEHARKFKSLLSRECEITFMGIWDTVKAYGWMRPQSFPALRHNPSVAAVRHAVALNELRSLFQMTGWGDRHDQVKEVWFAGDHSDVGGGHPSNSALADAAMTWMLGEATNAGLLIDPAQRSTVDAIVENSRLASQTEPSNLMKGWFRVPFPRVELDNTDYPPSRHPRIWPVGVRRPFAHAESSPILLHHTVRERQQRDPAYSAESLLRGMQGVRGFGVSKLAMNYEEDREIRWDKAFTARVE